MRVYQLKADVDNYRALTMNREADFDVGAQFNGQRLAQQWTPPHVHYIADDSGNSLPEGDFMSFGTIPAFRLDTAMKLKEALVLHGEILPLRSADGDFVAYNVTTLLDALDEVASDLSRFDDGRIMRIHKAIFRPDRIGGAEIFKLTSKQRPEVFVTDAFVSRVQALGLTGFEFRSLD